MRFLSGDECLLHQANIGLGVIGFEGFYYQLELLGIGGLLGENARQTRPD
jgi:hypothetical protein